MDIQGVSQSAQSTGPAQQDKKKLKEACQQFEAIFMNYLLKSMRKTVSKSDFFGSSKEEEIFQDMMDTEVCDKMSKTNSTGVATILYNQLSNQLGNGKDETANKTRGENR